MSIRELQLLIPDQMMITGVDFPAGTPLSLVLLHQSQPSTWEAQDFIITIVAALLAGFRSFSTLEHPSHVQLVTLLITTTKNNINFTTNIFALATYLLIPWWQVWELDGALCREKQQEA